MKVLYTLVGNLLSRQYNPVSWHRHRQKKSYTYPLPILAYASELKEKAQDFEIRFLVPHSIFTRYVSSIEELSCIDKLKALFMEDLLNYHRNRFLSFKNNPKGDLRKLIEFLEKADVDRELISELREREESKVTDRLEKLENELLLQLQQKDRAFRESTQLEKAKVEIVPSVGGYAFRDFKVSYRAESSYRKLAFFLLFARDVLKHIDTQDTEFILDLSTGLNALVTEAIDAFYSASVLSDFFYLGRKAGHKFFVIEAEPVIGADTSEEKSYRKEEVKKKAFFQNPLSGKDIKKHVKKLGTVLEPDRLSSALERSLLLFNILNYNLPLGLTLLAELPTWGEFIGLLRYMNESLVEKATALKLSKNAQGYSFGPMVPELDFKSVRDVMFMLMLGANISYQLETESVKASDSMSLNDLKKFLGLYRKYGLYVNETFLERELTNKKAICKKKLKSNQTRLLIHLENKVRASKRTDTLKRNFLAHCGLLADFTCVRREGKDIVFFYDKGRAQEITRIISEL